MLLRINQSSDKRKVIDYVERLPEGMPYTVEIKLKRKQRSTDQNRLYWMWLNCIMAETGEHKDRLHEFFKHHFLGMEEHRAFDRYSVPVLRSTASLDTKQMADYLERIRQFAAAELGIVLPDPEDLQWAEFEAQYERYI